MVCCTLRATLCHYNVSLFCFLCAHFDPWVWLFSPDNEFFGTLHVGHLWGLLRPVPKRWLSDFEIGCHFPWILWLWSSLGEGVAPILHSGSISLSRTSATLGGVQRVLLCNTPLEGEIMTQVSVLFFTCLQERTAVLKDIRRQADCLVIGWLCITE